MIPAISCPHFPEHEKYCPTCIWHFINNICTRDIKSSNQFLDILESNRNKQLNNENFNK